MSSDVRVPLHELSIEVKYLYITRKVFLMIRNSRLFMARYKYATTELAIYIRTYKYQYYFYSLVIVTIK